MRCESPCAPQSLLRFTIWLGAKKNSGFGPASFSSLRSALLVLANLPLALIGGVIAIFLTGRVMSVSSLIGFIGVFGIAARNGIILVSHYRHLRAEGRPRDEVILEGSKDRLAPVLMTAAAAALGVLPLVVGDLAGKELERPMAHVILGGLFTSTFLNMIVVPTFFARWGWESDETFARETVGVEARSFAAQSPRVGEPAPEIRMSLPPHGSSAGPAYGRETT